MRRVAIIALLIICRAQATPAQAVPPADPPWVANHPDITRLHTPGYILSIGLPLAADAH